MLPGRWFFRNQYEKMRENKKDNEEDMQGQIREFPYLIVKKYESRPIDLKLNEQKIVCT